jgi:hypothetical protein
MYVESLQCYSGWLFVALPQFTSDISALWASDMLLLLGADFQGRDPPCMYTQYCVTACFAIP